MAGESRAPGSRRASPGAHALARRASELHAVIRVPLPPREAALLAGLASRSRCDSRRRTTSPTTLPSPAVRQASRRRPAAWVNIGERVYGCPSAVVRVDRRRWLSVSTARGRARARLRATLARSVGLSALRRRCFSDCAPRPERVGRSAWICGGSLSCMERRSRSHPGAGSRYVEGVQVGSRHVRRRAVVARRAHAARGVFLLPCGDSSCVAADSRNGFRGCCSADSALYLRAWCCFQAVLRHVWPIPEAKRRAPKTSRSDRQPLAPLRIIALPTGCMRSRSCSAGSAEPCRAEPRQRLLPWAWLSHPGALHGARRAVLSRYCCRCAGSGLARRGSTSGCWGRSPTTPCSACRDGLRLGALVVRRTSRSTSRPVPH